VTATSALRSFVLGVAMERVLRRRWTEVVRAARIVID
jgi:hypothetical protein